MKHLVALSIALFSLHLHAQVTDFNIRLDARENSLPSADVLRSQGRVRIGFTIDAKGIVEIVGLAATGPGFNNDWATLHNSNGSTDQVKLAFRQLYLRKVMGNVTAEAGALSPEPTVGSAGSAPSGWMDGIRVMAHTNIGNIKVVAGSLGDFNQPNAFSREHKANFIEIELDHKVMENLISKTAFERYNGSNYIHETLSFDMKTLGHTVFKIFADALYDFEREAFNYEIGAEVDLLKTLIHKYDHRLDLKVYYSDVNANIPDRSQTLSAFYVYGPRVTVEVGGKIDTKGSLKWFARSSMGRQNRYDAGIALKIGKKK